jgi:hypothetical protein
LHLVENRRLAQRSEERLGLRLGLSRRRRVVEGDVVVLRLVMPQQRGLSDLAGTGDQDDREGARERRHGRRPVPRNPHADILQLDCKIAKLRQGAALFGHRDPPEALAQIVAKCPQVLAGQ